MAHALSLRYLHARLDCFDSLHGCLQSIRYGDLDRVKRSRIAYSTALYRLGYYTDYDAKAQLDELCVSTMLDGIRVAVDVLHISNNDINGGGYLFHRSGYHSLHGNRLGGVLASSHEFSHEYHVFRYLPAATSILQATCP